MWLCRNGLIPCEAMRILWNQLGSNCGTMASASCPSPVMSAPLGLDPSDPLNLLLHNHSQHDHRDTHDPDTDDPTSPPDWNILSSMWPPVDDQKLDFAMDFGLMDLPFDPNAGIEPTALNYPYPNTDPFQFTFESPHMSSRSSSESGSTSGSFSPLVAYSPPSSEFDDDPATELATRVRKSAGVMLAVQMNQNQQQHQQQIQQQQQQPIHPAPAYSPPSFTTSPVQSPALTHTPPSTTAAPQPRPKTSHTTIERRYRTNLNARIQSLRAAVPALRVVDRAAAAKAGAPPDPTAPDDVVDARGFVDGVRVARKCSKANVLGKAVEYIRVLKRREARLARELAGLKTLLAGLVGGRALLAEWEAEWTARFGGPETDEVGEGVDGAEEDADEEDGEESDDDEGRRRKKPKVERPKAPKPAAAPSQDGEKKKRGRRALGGRVARLAARVGRVLGGGEVTWVQEGEGDDGEEEGLEADVERLIYAVVLYRRVFGASTPTTAGKHSPAAEADARALRRMLAGEVFEEACVEEARDRIVDLLTGERVQ
ncbi:hypothetical protein B0H10DRAFT_1351132 [Mycena sp. CBHHK59/15]|nr:hypothetical protein B0H10DRAFT_1351132 [Mycena sp. CBHHK59/15]